MKRSVPISNDFCPQTLFLYGTYKEDGTANFGLFCWFSYIWDKQLGVMACIGGDKLTKERICKTKVFSANLVTEPLLPLADTMGNTDGNKVDKSAMIAAVEKGQKLNVPVLAESPLAFELEVQQTITLHDGEVFLCKICNVLADEPLCDKNKSIEERMKQIKPLQTTCGTYFSWAGDALGKWGECQLPVDERFL